jgi:hypothetical protein
MLAAAPVSLLLLPTGVSAQSTADGCGVATDGATVCVGAAPLPIEHAVAYSAAPAGAADTIDSDQAGDQAGVTTTTIVASESPNPGLGQGRAPEIGPIVVPAESSSFSGAWWLVAFGGVQLFGLFFITRRARTRLSTDDARS